MAAPPPKFHMREMEEGDARFLEDSFDSSVRHLAASGSVGQWGPQTFAERGEAADKHRVVAGAALRYMTTGEGEVAVRIFIAEVEVPSLASLQQELPDVFESLSTRKDGDGRVFLAVGTVRLSEDFMPDYICAVLGAPDAEEAMKKELEGKRDYVWLEALITDFRTGKWRKGVGAAMIRFSEAYCLSRSKPTLYLDSWTGNEGVLVKYYTGQGFSVLGYFGATKPDGSYWQGAVYSKDATDAKHTSQE